MTEEKVALECLLNNGLEEEKMKQINTYFGWPGKV